MCSFNFNLKPSTQSTFSMKELKCAKIVPIYKKKLKIDPGNYRPVSILSIISKIFEKVVCEQLSEYLE